MNDDEESVRSWRIVSTDHQMKRQHDLDSAKHCCCFISKPIADMMETAKPNSLDINPLMRLKEALEGAQRNTSKMLNRLERFEHRLTDLDEKMRPIQTTTKHYTKAKENISLTLAEIGKTSEYFRIAADVKDIVQAGLSPDTQEEYFEALGRLSNAKRYFETHHEIKASVTILSTIDGLLSVMVTACVSEFERILQASGKSIATSGDGQHNIINPLTPEAARDIKSLCDMFEKNNHTAHFKVYQTVRIAKLKAELKAQETACAAQWTAAALDGPYEKGSHPFKEYFLLAYWLLRSELQLWGSTLPSNEESLHVFVAICEALIAELQRVLSPILSEEKISKNNNPAVRKSKLVLVRLDVLETFNDRYEEFRDLCRPDVRHESAASMSLSAMRTAVVTACARSIEYMTSSGITEGFSTVENKADVASACDLHPAAGNIMYCCSEVQDYAAPYRRMRELSNAYYSSASAKQQLELPPVPPNSIPTDTDEFTTIVLDNLFAALEERAAKFDEKGRPPLKRGLSAKSHSLFEAEDKAAEEMILTARKHLFMANNLYSVSNHLREIIEKGEDSATAKKRAVPVAGVKGKAHRLAPFAKKVETRLLAEQTAFCDVLLSALGMSPQEMAEFSSEYARDKSGQGRLLKAKFSTFNTGMDALLAQQGEWRVAAAGLRDRLAALMVTKIQSEYNAFYSTYSVVKFSKKHMDEYLKYPPAVVERHLTGFFGRA